MRSKLKTTWFSLLTLTSFIMMAQTLEATTYGFRCSNVLLTNQSDAEQICPDVCKPGNWPHKSWFPAPAKLCSLGSCGCEFP